MPRPRTVSDQALLDAALDVVHRSGPAALSFSTLAGAVGLAGSTIVQRFGTKAALLHAALAHAWDRLDADTAAAIADASPDAAGVVDMLVALTGQYETDDFADQLLVLREDLRDPELRQRGQHWIELLAAAVDERVGGAATASDGRLGELVVAQWQGTLTVWGFTRGGPLANIVRTSLEMLLARELANPSPPRRAELRR